MIKKIFFLGCITSLTLAISCSNESSKKEIVEQSKEDSLAACSNTTIMDPNNAKPMALMMRQMAANADSMKQRILRNEVLDSLQFPFIKFYLVEPTDPNVLEPNFFEKSRLHQAAYLELFRYPKEQKKYYNFMIESCVSCHKDYCSGPLK
ncbi:MAG: hypothetical protein MH472_09780, partial [Bacteroidia bacterium]|nr:hypothetical protein [Bacteroidia bacterium]